MPVLVGLLVWLGLTPTSAALLAAAALAVGAVTSLTGVLQQIQVGNIFQRIYGLASLRSLISEIFQSQAARDVATAAETTYPAVESDTFAVIVASNPSKDAILVYTEVTYRHELVYIWQQVIAAYNNNLISYSEMLQWVAWANSIPIRPGDPIFTWAVAMQRSYESAGALLPSFSTLETLQTWYEYWEGKYAAQTITYAEYSRIYTHYSAEYDRLTAVVAPPVPIVEPSPAVVLTTVEARLAEIRDKIAALSLAPPSEIAPRLAEIRDMVAGLKLSVTIPESAIKVDVAPATVNVAVDVAALQAALVAATAAAGTQVADGAKEISKTIAETKIDPAIATAAIVTALASTGVVALSKIAKSWGHDAASGARTCWAATAADLFGQIAGAAVPLSLAVAADKFSPIREAMNALMQRVFDEIMNAPELQTPVPPERAPAVAAALFRKAFELGQAAHLLAVLAEVVTPLKMLGVGQVAAFLADMAGFAKIGGAAMGVIESQALGRPFGYYMNRKTLTNRPNTGQLAALASDQAITKEEYISEMAYQGFVRDWSEDLYDTTFRALAPRQLQMMAEAGIAGDDYFDRELKHGGLRPETITLVKEMFRLAALGELKPTGQALAIKRFKEGITNDAELNTELESLGFRGTKLAKAFQVARLDRDTDLLLERITIVVNAYLGDDITEGQLQAQLTSLGLEPERVKVIVDRAVQRYRPPRLPDRLPRLREQYANTLLNNVELGFAAPENISPGLLALGYTTTEARLAIDNSKEIARQALLKDQIAILEERLTDKEITLDQLRMQLLTLHITPEQVNAQVELNRLRLQPTPKTPTAEELPTLTTAQVLAAYKAEILPEEETRLELELRKYLPETVTILLRLNAPTAKAPAKSEIKLATEAELKAWLAAGLITPEETYAGLIARGRSDLDARRIIELELIKAEARTKV